MSSVRKYTIIDPTSGKLDRRIFSDAAVCRAGVNPGNGCIERVVGAIPAGPDTSIEQFSPEVLEHQRS